MTLHEVSGAIREVGQIWSIEWPEYGTLFRAEIDRRQVRIVVPKPYKKKAVEIAKEKNSLEFLVNDLGALKNWLSDLKNNQY